MSGHPPLEETLRVEPAREGASAPESGTSGGRFGDYLLIRELGRGGMGVVYEAYQPDLDRRVALKVLLDRRFEVSDARAVVEEARAGARIRHPHSVGVYEIGEAHGQPYIAMEYVEGEDLSSRIASAPPTSDEAAFLIEKVCRAVDVLHENGLIHRDLKPANILIDGEGDPRVSDFGLARSIASLVAEGSTGIAVGTPAYMSPEQAQGRFDDMGPWTDVFAIGVMLYELLCGQRPFDASEAYELLSQVAIREPELPRAVRPDVPRALEAICLRCLEKDPKRRYARAGEIAEDLRRYLQGEMVLARPLSAPMRLRRWARRRPVIASHLVALGCFFALEQVWYARGAVDFAYHVNVSGIVAAWTASCLALAVLSRRSSFERWAPYAWASVDVGFLTAALINANGASSALIACFYIFLAAEGFWFRGSVVRFAMGLVCFSYGVLMWDGFRRPQYDLPYHADATMLVSFLAVGIMVASQVERVRSLGRYMRGRA